MAVQNNHKHDVKLISPPNPPAELVNPEQIDEIIQYCQGLIQSHNRKIELAKQQLSQARNLKVFLEKFNQQVASNNDYDEAESIDDILPVSSTKQKRIVTTEERVRFSRMPFSEKGLHLYFKKGSNPKTMDLIEEVLRKKYPLTAVSVGSVTSKVKYQPSLTHGQNQLAVLQQKLIAVIRQYEAMTAVIEQQQQIWEVLIREIEGLFVGDTDGALSGEGFKLVGEMSGVCP